jgi:rubrerythrin
MGITFNADEVLEMAVRIEANGKSFYLRAAELQSDNEVVSFFERLAAMEEQHKQTFEEFRQDLSAADKEGQAYDPDGQALMYLATMADAHGGEGDPRIAATLTGDESLEEILRTALNLEKQSILFYVGLKDLVPRQSGKDKVDEVIEEEKLHIAQLSEVLRKTLES